MFRLLSAFGIATILNLKWTNGFVVTPFSLHAVTTTAGRRSTSPIPLSMAFYNDDDAAASLAHARNEARTDVRNLLTQRAIQSFMFMCETLRDPHSVKWLEEFLNAPNSLDYHGTAASYILDDDRFEATWDAPLLAMMQQPKDVMIVSAKRTGKGTRGWSKNNPYLEDRYVEFEIDIDPVSLASRILAVREQIANEFLQDLNILQQANSQILDSYFAFAKQERSKQEQQQQQSSSPSSNRPDVTFERTAVNILNNHTAFTVGSSSPFRKGNFDLLYNLCTQASIHRVLRRLGESLSSSSPQSELTFEWFRDFYSERVANYFDGDVPYGRADDFMDELLQQTPSIGPKGIVDPLGLAEQIIEVRTQVVEEWKVLMARVPQDHADGIRKELLNKQMAAWGQGPSLEEQHKEGFQ